MMNEAALAELAEMRDRLCASSDSRDEARLRRLFRSCWSERTSPLWSPANPSRGQCAVTALVINDHLGGEILKTEVLHSWHFYNRVGGRALDLTAEQFAGPIEYADVLSSRVEALLATSQAEYEALSASIVEVVAYEFGAPRL